MAKSPKASNGRDDEKSHNGKREDNDNLWGIANEPQEQRLFFVSHSHP